MISGTRTLSQTNLYGLILCLVTTLTSEVTAQWAIQKGNNPDGPGSRLSIQNGNQPVAAWTYGEGQFKPYLHVFGPSGARLTNSGLDQVGKMAGKFGHHRGIFIGWNRIESDLGRHDLWHMKKGTSMEIAEFTQLVTTGHHAVTEAHIIWSVERSDAQSNDLLIDEHRQISVSHPNASITQIDFHSKLKAARDLKLGGDLQHAGIHFRAENEVATRPKETAYVWHPDLPAERRGVISKEWQWATLIFPIGDRWYRCTEMTAPENEFSELSWRDYGRFGFFDKKELKKGQTLELRFRFLITEIQDVDDPAQSESYKASIRQDNKEAYQTFLNDIASADQ